MKRDVTVVAVADLKGECIISCTRFRDELHPGEDTR
jgi:hypothetical protein